MNCSRLIRRIMGLCVAMTMVLPLCVSASDDNKITFGGKRYSLAFSDDFNDFDEDKWARCPEQERQEAGGVWSDSCSYVQDVNLVITCDVDDD